MYQVSHQFSLMGTAPGMFWCALVAGTLGFSFTLLLEVPFAPPLLWVPFFLYFNTIVFILKHRSSRCGSVVMNLTSIHEDMSLIPGPAQWVTDPILPVSYGVSCRCGSDPRLLLLWCMLVATVQIRSLAWELLYAMGAALKKKKRSIKTINARVYGANRTLLQCWWECKLVQQL